MIDELDLFLRDWVSTVVGEIPVSLSPPGPGPDGEMAVGLYLLEIGAGPALRTSGPQPLQVLLRYLVTVRSPEPEEGHRKLAELLFAALETPELEVGLEPLPVALWQAFGVAPRPAFTVRLPLLKERNTRPVRRVREPLVVEASPLARLSGVVLGPGDLPLAGARVELPALNVSAQTDFQGRFHFAAVPAGSSGTLRVQARGRELAVTPERPADPGSPLIVRFPLLED